ncbi:MAG: hypothetical protein RI897_3783 [Verrucomicrobiota bacterium]
MIFAQGEDGHGHGEVGFSGAGGADSESEIMFADCLDVGFLADGFWGDSGFAGGGLDAFPEEFAEGTGAFVADDIDGVGELAVADHMAGPRGGFEVAEHMFDRGDRIVGSFELDPAFTGGDLDTQFILEQLEVSGVVVEELLGESFGFELQRFEGHGCGVNPWG